MLFNRTNIIVWLLIVSSMFNKEKRNIRRMIQNEALNMLHLDRFVFHGRPSSRSWRRGREIHIEHTGFFRSVGSLVSGWRDKDWIENDGLSSSDSMVRTLGVLRFLAAIVAHFEVFSQSVPNLCDFSRLAP